VTRVLSHSLLVTLLILVGPTAVRALDAADLPAAIENAKTAADHEAIAAHYEAQAKAARTEAERHRSMGAIYKKHSAHTAGKATRTALDKTMPPHCDELATSYEAAAKQYDAMAAAEREAASEAQ
jgi:hypothetical protein